MFVIESVHDSALGGDSIENLLPSIRDYFGDLKQRGELDNSHLRCRGIAEVHSAIQSFMVWATNKPPEDPKWLWISLHGKRPARPEYVGTKGLVVDRRPDGEADIDGHDEFDWYEAFGRGDASFPPNVMIVMDVCWGGSPSAASRASRRGGGPRMLFGPVRSAHRVELNTAAGLLTAALQRGALPTVAEAKRLVTTLNRSFSKDIENGKEFYRVWWWGPKGSSFFPRPKTGLKRMTQL